MRVETFVVQENNGEVVVVLFTVKHGRAKARTFIFEFARPLAKKLSSALKAALSGEDNDDE